MHFATSSITIVSRIAIASDPYFCFCHLRKSLTPLTSSDWSSMEEEDSDRGATQKHVTFKKETFKEKAVVALQNIAPVKQNRKRPVVNDVAEKPAAKALRRDSSASDSGSIGSDEDDDGSNELTQSTKNGGGPHLPQAKNQSGPPLPAPRKRKLLTQPVVKPQNNFDDDLEVKPECLGLFESESRQRAAKEVARMALMVFSSDSETDYDLEELPPSAHAKKQSKKKGSFPQNSSGKNRKGSKVSLAVKSSKSALNNVPSHVQVKIEPGVMSDSEQALPKSSSLRMKEVDTAATGSSSKVKLSLHREKSMTG